MSLSAGPSRSELALLADPRLLAERIAQLEAAEEQANSVLKLIGPANEILEARQGMTKQLDGANEKANFIRNEAQEVLIAANAEAQKIVDTAEEEAKELLILAQARDDDAIDRQTAAQENLAETERETVRLQGLQEELVAREKEFDERQKILNEDQASLLQEKAQLTIICEHMTEFLD